MPIVAQVLEAKLLQIAQEIAAVSGDEDPATIQQKVAREQAQYISEQILTLTVTIPAGIPVTVATPTGPGTGATTAPIIATLQ